VRCGSELMGQVEPHSDFGHRDADFLPSLRIKLGASVVLVLHTHISMSYWIRG
jgi:hypothetical protein